MGEYNFFLDTNIFLRAIIKDEARKAGECNELLYLTENGKFTAATSTLVLVELAWTGMSFYKIPKAEMAQVLKGLIKMRGLKILDGCNFLQAIFYMKKTALN